MAQLAQLLSDFVVKQVSFKKHVEPHADREDVLLDAIVERTGDPLAFRSQEFRLLRCGELLAELLQLVDHEALALVQPRVVNSYGDLPGKRNEQPLVVRVVSVSLIGNADHSNDRVAQSERNAEELADRWVAVGLSDAVRIVAVRRLRRTSGSR